MILHLFSWLLEIFMVIFTLAIVQVLLVDVTC